MGINFNPSMSVKPATHVETRKINNTSAEKNSILKDPENTKTEGSFENNGQIAALIALNPDVITAAELVARAHIIMAQQYGMPPAVAESADVAEIFRDKALKLEKLVNSKAEKISEFYTKEAASSPDDTERKIFKGKDGAETMFEYSPSGELLRESLFKDGVLQKAEEFRADGKKNVLIMSKGDVAEYMEGLEETEEGRTMERYFTFENGEKSMYFENYSELSDGSSGASKWVWFQDGKMCAYYEDIENASDGSSVIGLHLRYGGDGELYEYAADIISGKTLGKHFKLKDGKWTEV